MDDNSYQQFNRKTGDVEARVDKPTTFPYMDPKTGRIEQRSLYPNLFARVVENFSDPAALSIQRERYLKTLQQLGETAPPKKNWHSAE